jgi:hypothetical protein
MRDQLGAGQKGTFEQGIKRGVEVCQGQKRERTFQTDGTVSAKAQRVKAG